MDSTALVALGLGLLLGLKHATDADHVVAISTIVSEYRNAWRGIWVGASWGLGHTTPLLLLGATILLLKGRIMHQYEAAAPYLEFGVGIMLVFLGVQVFWNLRKKRLHLHEHLEEEHPHAHIHAHGQNEETADSRREGVHHFFSPGRPFFRLKSYLIGIVHGMAGSAAVMLAVLASDAINNFWIGIWYILLFGLGTIISMGVITLVLGVPFAITGQYQRINRMVAGVAGTASIGFGVFLMYDLAVAGRL
ncbi:MAG: sulfite exporter TauE/SafE family protein [Chloroflexi bacterium]|nr:sulfite exporter TauE/SafE family protein [Chloroflexota bacterium]